VMWTAILLFVYLLSRALRAKLTPHSAELLLILAFPVSMSPRTWFGSTQGVTADIAASCYPFLLVLGPYLLWSFLSKASPKIPATLIIGCLVMIYGAARVPGGSFLFSERNYRTLETAAGAVRISDYAPGIDIYRYVEAHTAPSDYVLELPYGGGINFASGRPNPIFDTMMFNMQIPAEYQRKDLERMVPRAPKLIIAQDSPRLGTNFSFGSAGNRACVCPRLVWIPDVPSWDPDYVYPLVEYIARNYRPAARIGGKVILEPNPPIRASQQPLPGQPRL